MKKFLNKILLCATLCLSSNIANAHDGLYLGGQGGYSWIRTPRLYDHKAAGGALKDAEVGDYAFGVNAGYEKEIQGGFSAGVELGYNDDGHSTITYASGNRYKITSTDVELLLTGKQQVCSTPYYFQAKAGVAAIQQIYKLDRVASSVTPDRKTSTYGYRPVLALVSGYNLTDKWDLNVSYKHIFANRLNRTSKVFHTTNASAGSADVYRGIAAVDNVSLGLAYHF